MLSTEYRRQRHPNRSRVLQLVWNHPSIQQTLEKKVRESVRRQSSRDFRVPNCVRGEPNGGVYDVAIGGGTEQPSDAMGVRLATVPVNDNFLGNPNRRSHDSE